MVEIDLNNQIGELLDMPQATEYLVKYPDGYASIISFPTRLQAERWLAENPIAGGYIEARKNYQNYSVNLEASKLIVDEMGNRGFWMKLTSPHNPYECPHNPKYQQQWEETRYNWYASFDYHGTTDSRPLWQAGHTNPAMAIVLAAISCIEGNPELFKELSF